MRGDSSGPSRSSMLDSPADMVARDSACTSRSDSLNCWAGASMSSPSSAQGQHSVWPFPPIDLCDATKHELPDARFSVPDMSSLPITSVFNDGYIAELYEAYRKDPASVDESWRQFFRFAATLSGTPASVPASPADTRLADRGPEFLRKAASAAKLIDAIREYGHLA